MESAVLTRVPLALRLTPVRAAHGFAALGGLVALWNALSYPAGAGYDAHAHQTYSDFVLAHGRPPVDRAESWEYYSPPLYYYLAAAATWLGRQGGLADPYKVAQLLNVPAVVGTVLLVAALARLLWPGRPWTAAAAAGFVALSPVLARTAAMFHPEPLDLLLAALSGYLAVRLFVRRASSLRAALGVGLALGLAQTVRQFALYTLAVVAAAWLVAVVRRPGERRELLRAGLVALAACAVLAGPWYAYRAANSSNALFDRPQSSKPLLERRPARFYLGSGLPDLFVRPYRPHMANLAWPETYADVWGDWFGYFAWKAGSGPSSAQRAWLVAQNGIGIAPTALALAGWLLLLGAAVRRRAAELLVVALVPLAGLAGYFYFAIAYPTPDGDVLKPLFMLSTLWAWALCFGWAAGGVAARAPRLAAWTLGLLALADLPFLLYRGAHGLF